MKPKDREMNSEGNEGKIWPWTVGKREPQHQGETERRAGPGADAPDQETKSIPPSRKHLNSLRSEHLDSHVCS